MSRWFFAATVILITAAGIEDFLNDRPLWGSLAMLASVFGLASLLLENKKA